METSTARSPYQEQKGPIFKAEFGWHHEVYFTLSSQGTGRERFYFNTKEKYMKKFIFYFTPFVIFFIYRIVMCLIELKRNEKFRVKKGKFYSVKHIYAEIGLFSGATIAGVLILLMPQLWFIFAALGVALCYFGFKIGRQKGIEFDNALRELALEMQKMETDELTYEEHPAIAENATQTDEANESDEESDHSPAEEECNAESAKTAEEENAPVAEEQEREDE